MGKDLGKKPIQKGHPFYGMLIHSAPKPPRGSTTKSHARSGESSSPEQANPQSQLPSPELILISLGRRFAAQDGVDCGDWSEDELMQYGRDAFSEKGETVRKVSWRNGSFAGVIKFENDFLGYDDAGGYGPFESYKAACPGISDSYDDYLENWTHPDYK